MYVYVHTPTGLKSNPHDLFILPQCFGFSCMACSDCRVFLGNPVCGACRAGARIVGILRSGRLPVSEEKRVVALLRGAAGELSDLLEGSLPAGGAKEAEATPTQGETPGSTPEPIVKKAAKEEKEGSEYSYTEGEEEEEPKVKDSPGGEAASTTDSIKQKEDVEPKETEKEPASSHREGEPVKKDPPKRTYPNFDPHYLTKRLQLFPCGKASATGRQPAVEPTRREERGEVSRRDHSRESDRSPRPGRGPSSPDRPPLERRRQPRKKQTAQKKKKKKTRAASDAREVASSRLGETVRSLPGTGGGDHASQGQGEGCGRVTSSGRGTHGWALSAGQPGGARCALPGPKDWSRSCGK